MKEYKLKINGNDYAVTVNEVDGSMAEVEVNGTPFKVEFDKPVKKAAAPVAKPVAKSAAPAPDGKHGDRQWWIRFYTAAAEPLCRRKIPNDIWPCSGPAYPDNWPGSRSKWRPPGPCGD